MHDLASSSFSSLVVGLANPWNLNDKGINVASFNSYLGAGVYATTQGNASNEVYIWDNVTIVINLPTVSLVKRLLPTPKDCGSNPVISKLLYRTLVYCQL